MKHCPSCMCVSMNDNKDPNCAACNAKNTAMWDVHHYAEKVRTGEMISSDVAREIGISRQAVEQAFTKHQVKAVVAEGRKVRRDAKMEKILEKRRQRADEPNIAWARAHPKGLNLIPSEYMIESLQAVHTFLKLGDQAMSRDLYDEMRPKHLPSGATIMDRFETWNKACEEAELPCNAPPRTYTRQPRERAVDDVKRFIVAYRAEHGRYATVGAAKYEAWAKNKDNKAVSKALISKRFGWHDILSDALKELYGYRDTHVSTHDGSPAMLVSEDDTTITLVNEDGVQWTDPREDWKPIGDHAVASVG